MIVEGHLVLRDARGDFGVVNERVVLAVEGVDRGDVAMLALTRNAGGIV